MHARYYSNGPVSVCACVCVCLCLSQVGVLLKRLNVGSGRLKMHDLKMQDWKMTDNILANSEQNYGVWKMQDWKMTDHVT